MYLTVNKTGTLRATATGAAKTITGKAS